MGTYTENTYDAKGNIEKRMTKSPGDDLLSWVEYRYNDPLNRLSETCQKLFKYLYNDEYQDLCTKTGYYPSGKAKEKIDFLGEKEEYYYNQRGLQSKIIQFLPNGIKIKETEFVYDENGNKNRAKRNGI